MYIKKYWGNFIGGSDDSLNLVAFLEDQKKEEISLSEIFTKIGLDKQNGDFRQTVEYLEFTHSNGVEMDFHFAIDVATDLAAILLECSVSGSVNLHDLDEYNTPARRIRITATPEEHDAMDKSLADFAQNPLEYDLSEMMDEDEIQEMARDVEALRKELYEAAGRNRNYHVKAEDVKHLLPDWEGADGCIATNRITVEGCKVGYCYREKPDGGWDSGWRFTAGDESEAYMDDPNNAGIYKLNTICNDDPDIIPLLNTPAPCAFARDENGVFQPEVLKPEEMEEPDMDILKQCQKWHEEDKHQKIVDALEAIPVQERTPEMDMELARAYNNLADPGEPEGRRLLHRALELMQSHEEELGDTYSWNFRMGYACFYLDQEGRALPYFEKALELHPGDDPKFNTRQDIEELIDWCKEYIEQQDELDETLTGMDYIPYTPQNEEAFFAQLEQWNDEDEYTRCIQALNAIPEDWRNYRTAYALARALENYAIIGDHDEGTPNYKGDKALHRAIEVLESVREEGQDKAQWNMRMAYAYQYLYGQEEKAIPYAQRWAELAPEDEDAPAVIRECREEIAKRAGADCGTPEMYTPEQMSLVEQHIQQYFGKFENVFHEIVSPDIHVDICIVPPTEERDYYTLVTIGMGAHRMNVPSELADQKLERAELALALPPDWKLEEEALKEGRWYWPIRLLKALARLPIASDTWLGWGHTMDNQEPFAEDTELCAALLIAPQRVEEKGLVCVLPDGDEVNFYQVIPLYREEMEYKLAHDAEALLDRMSGVSFVVWPDRPGALSRRGRREQKMDDGAWHLESIREKKLPVEEITAYNHMAIYLRWCIEQDLMEEDFLAKYGDVAEKVKTDPAGVDLRAFIRDELAGQLTTALFNETGAGFAWYYYGDLPAPHFPCDIDDYSLRYFGPARYHSDEFQDEAYLFIPFDEEYYQAMARLMEKRFANWKGQDFDENTLEPSETARTIMEYLDCECEYFPAMKDDDPVAGAYGYAKRLGVRDGCIPMLIRADDETLLECLVMNADPDNEGEEDYAFDPETVEQYRRKMLAAPVRDGKTLLEELTAQRKAEAGEDDLDWEEILGEMGSGYANDRFASYWDSDTDRTCPLILAKIPVKNPWEVFAWLPFGNWNDCPDTPELMAAAKYWFEQYGAVPAVLSHDELEFALPAPVPEEKAMELAEEQYGLCPDMDQNFEEVGSLADTLRQSTVWYFWWD